MIPELLKLNQDDTESWNRAKKWMKVGAVSVAAAVGLLTSCYMVPTDSSAVVKRLGKFSHIGNSGLNLKLPFGIDRVTKVPVRRIQNEEFGFRTLKHGVDSKYLGSSEIERGLVQMRI